MSRALFDPGTLDHRFVIERVVETADGCGGVAITFDPVATVWATLEPASARSAEISQQVVETMSHAVTMRFRDDLASGWRLVQGLRVFTVLTVHDPDERRRYITCRVVEEGR